MKLTINDRKQLVADFNEKNCTTNIHSKYTGVKVDGMCLVFKHTNGVGFERVSFDYNKTDGLFTRQEIFEGLEKHLGVSK